MLNLTLLKKRKIWKYGIKVHKRAIPLLQAREESNLNKRMHLHSLWMITKRKKMMKK